MDKEKEEVQRVQWPESRRVMSVKDWKRWECSQARGHAGGPQ